MKERFFAHWLIAACILSLLTQYMNSNSRFRALSVQLCNEKVKGYLGLVGFSYGFIIVRSPRVLTNRAPTIIRVQATIAATKIVNHTKS